MVPGQRADPEGPARSGRGDRRLGDRAWRGPPSSSALSGSWSAPSRQRPSPSPPPSQLLKRTLVAASAGAGASVTSRRFLPALTGLVGVACLAGSAFALPRPSAISEARVSRRGVTPRLGGAAPLLARATPGAPRGLWPRSPVRPCPRRPAGP